MSPRSIFGATILLAVAFVSSSQPPPREQVGPLADGGFLLNSGWRVKPAGVQIPLDTLPMASLLSKDGRFLVVLNGGYQPPSLSVLDTKDGHEIGRTPLTDAWLGLAFSPNGRTLWVGGGSQASVYEFSFDENGKLAPTRTFEIVKAAERTARDFIGDVAIDPDGHLLYACDLFHDAIIVVNTQSGIVIDRFKTGRRPYRILFNPDGKSFYVSSWADGTLYRHQTSNGAPLQALRLGAHPTDMVWRERAARAEEGGGDAQQPSFKARIFVTAANTNNAYSAAVADNGDLRVLETINVSTTPNHPLGMTPSALALSPDQSRLYVVCSDANAAAVVDVTSARSQVLGFVPTGWYPTAARALSDGRLVVLNGKGRPAGSASFIPALTDDSLASYTAEVKSNSPYTDDKLDEVPAGIPAAIRHVIYIVSGPESAGPNHQKLAHEFVTFDNFYANGDAGADGINWSTSAIANDYVEKMAPSNAAGRNLNPGFEGGEPAALPPAGYLWTNALAAGITMRNYGFWVANEAVLDSSLAKVTNLKYRTGAQVFLDDLAQFGSANQMPALILIRLPNDDQAVGTIVEAVSRSKFWGSTAIFVVGPSRSALLLSPYTHTGTTDSNMYNTTSVLRTMELILHLRPMTHFDAGARPMIASFSQQPSPAAYQSVAGK
jgi:DNA-binding beta-propeller fold protein YncE